MAQWSVDPNGEKLTLPAEADYAAEKVRLEALVAEKKSSHPDLEVVVVMGLGFVGAAMATVVADYDEKRSDPKLVIGMQRPSTRSFWKIAWINRGLCPMKSEDPLLPQMLFNAVKRRETLTATFSYDALELADVVVVDIQCDYEKHSLGNVKDGRAAMGDLEKSFAVIGERIQPKCLVLIETTVVPGTTEQIAYPIVKKAFRSRGIPSDPLLAHSFERVMPGKNYVGSIRDFWRVCSGVNEEAKDRVVKFFNQVLNTQDYPLTVLDKPVESETAKVVENSFRATILAFMDEWSLYCERTGVDLKKVIEAIKVRPTHSNIMFPGPGIGGYCLPKDGGFGPWSYRHIYGYEDEIFKMTPMAIDINDTRSLHVPQLVRDGLKTMGKPLASADVLVLGASYREDVGDTRYSGSELIVRRLTEMGAEVKVHDPYVDHWWEFKAQDSYPVISPGKARFFDRQEKLVDLPIEKDMWEAMKGVDVLVLGVRHKDYLGMDPKKVIGAVGKPCVVVDCFCILNDEDIKGYLSQGCEVLGMGRGHIARLKDQATAGKPTRKDTQTS